MKQFSIKNDRAAKLLEDVTRLTGEGKTEAVLNALRLYRDRLLSAPGVDERLEDMRQNVHERIKPEYLGTAPSKAEIERILGMT